MVASPLWLKNKLLAMRYVQYLVCSDYDVSDMDGDIELRHLRFFVAVAEGCTLGVLRFACISHSLHSRNRSASSKGILGYPLFLRTSRAVKLRRAGRSSSTGQDETLHNVQEDMEEARSWDAGKRKAFLSVGFIGSAMLTAFAAMLGGIDRLYPRVNLQLHESCTSAGNPQTSEG